MSQKTFFFCGIGGSGMSALALIMAQKGARVMGSDRARDQGQSPDKFKQLEKLGIQLFPQDGSGVKNIDALIVSSAVEPTIPDVRAALDQNISIRKRAELLAEIFNSFKTPIAVAGTSGKSTVTGMLATVLEHIKIDPTVMNGGLIRNFDRRGHNGLANMRVGKSDIFVAETDESDGSIALYNPAVAVLNNVALDHKSMEELDQLFGDFVGRASKGVVLNADDEKSYKLKNKAKASVISYGIENPQADMSAQNIKLSQAGSQFEIKMANKTARARLNVPGRHNISNALACLAATQFLGVDLERAIAALVNFEGVKRRMEVIGTKNNITVIDDFGHNHDKIAATLKTLKEFPGRVIVMFQPHGFGPLKLMGRQIAETFVDYLAIGDFVFMPEAFYAGGTVDRSVTAQDVISYMGTGKIHARWFEKRDDILLVILEMAQPGDRIVIMGARDDTLSDFAKEIYNRL